MKMRSKDQPALGNRVYREQMRPTGLVGYRVWEQESDLMVFTASDLTDIATNKLRHLRRQLIHYIDHDQLFLTSLSPVEVASDAPAVVQSMARAASSAGVGPMAAVAGAIADAIGWELLQKTDEVIIENGGDIFLKTALPRQVLVQAGNSVFSGRIALEVAPTELPVLLRVLMDMHSAWARQTRLWLWPKTRPWLMPQRQLSVIGCRLRRMLMRL